MLNDHSFGVVLREGSAWKRISFTVLWVVRNPFQGRSLSKGSADLVRSIFAFHTIIALMNLKVNTFLVFFLWLSLLSSRM